MTIFGSTGTGKTKLSVELALFLSSHPTTQYPSGAEIISCDSMQIYRGLDVITNKATTEEMQGVPHHLISFLDPSQPGEKGGYDVTRFVEDTNRIAGRLVGEGKCPIVCGGTGYYAQHLLFPGRLITSSDADAKHSSPIPLDQSETYRALTQEEKELLEQISTDGSAKSDLASSATKDRELGMKLWKLLDRIDPVMAARWHYRDSRKIANSLRVFKETGQAHSYWISQQDNKTSSSPAKSGVAGYRKLLFWLWCDPPVLRSRLDDRVDEMVLRGLIEEVKEMRSIAKRTLDDITGRYQLGIFQTIGYRQFAEYLDKLESLAYTTETEEKNGFDSAVEDTKTATRQYAKSQLKWVQNKLIPEVRRAQAAFEGSPDVELYLLDATDPTAWNEKVLQPALKILTSFLHRQTLPDPRDVSNPIAAETYLFGGPTANQALTKLGQLEEGREGVRTIQANKLFTCSICTSNPAQPVLVREVDRETHRKGRHHRNNVKRRMGQEEKQSRIAEKISQGELVRAERQRLKEKP